MIAHDRIRLIGPVYKMQKPALLRGFLHCTLTAKSLLYLTHAAGAGKLPLHIRLILTLIGEELGVIHLREACQALLIFFFRNCLVGRKTVHVVGAREEGETADDIPVLLYPIHDTYPLVFAH